MVLLMNEITNYGSMTALPVLYKILEKLYINDLKSLFYNTATYFTTSVAFKQSYYCLSSYRIKSGFYENKRKK